MPKGPTVLSRSLAVLRESQARARRALLDQQAISERQRASEDGGRTTFNNWRSPARPAPRPKPDDHLR